MNILKQKIIKKLEKDGLKDLSDKVEEIVGWINKQENPQWPLTKPEKGHEECGVDQINGKCILHRERTCCENNRCPCVEKILCICHHPSNVLNECGANIIVNYRSTYDGGLQPVYEKCGANKNCPLHKIELEPFTNGIKCSPQGIHPEDTKKCTDTGHTIKVGDSCLCGQR